MRKIVAGLFMSLDGVIEAPGEWHFPYFNDEMGNTVQAQMDAADTMLLGRVTYEEFAGFWPNQGADYEEAELAEYMNQTPKLVASNTLVTVDWANSSLIKGDVSDELRALKQQPGKNISITGSGGLVRSLLRDGVVDELRLLIHPIVVGKGKRLFESGEVPTGLELVALEQFETGVVSTVYVPAKV